MEKLKPAKIHNYRNALEILQSPTFKKEYDDIINVISATPVLVRKKAKKPRKRGKRTMTFTTDQGGINEHMAEAFRERAWEVHPLVLKGEEETVSASQLAADFRKGRVQIEVQFGNIARWAYDIFKLQVSFSLKLIDVGICVVPTKAFAGTIDENIAYYERVERELPLARNSITLPILVIGVSP